RRVPERADSSFAANGTKPFLTCITTCGARAHHDLMAYVDKFGGDRVTHHASSENCNFHISSPWRWGDLLLDVVWVAPTRFPEENLWWNREAARPCRSGGRKWATLLSLLLCHLYGVPCDGSRSHLATVHRKGAPGRPVRLIRSEIDRAAGTCRTPCETAVTHSYASFPWPFRRRRSPLVPVSL